MSLVELATPLLKLGFVTFLVGWLGIAAISALHEFVVCLRYPFMTVRRNLGAEERLAPKHTIVIALLASKTCAALVAVGISMLLGLSGGWTLVAVAAAFLLLG